jgi:hypothetical protein
VSCQIPWPTRASARRARLRTASKRCRASTDPAGGCERARAGVIVSYILISGSTSWVSSVRDSCQPK